jgi:hypothetical protein
LDRRGFAETDTRSEDAFIFARPFRGAGEDCFDDGSWGSGEKALGAAVGSAVSPAGGTADTSAKTAPARSLCFAGRFRLFT